MAFMAYRFLPSPTITIRADKGWAMKRALRVMRSRTGTSALCALPVRLKAAEFSFLQTGNPIFFL